MNIDCKKYKPKDIVYVLTCHSSLTCPVVSELCHKDSAYDELGPVVVSTSCQPGNTFV